MDMLKQMEIAIGHVSEAQLREVRKLMREYLDWVYTLAGSEGAPTFEGVEEELANLPHPFAPPTGRFLVATVDGQVAGFVGLKRIDDTTGELKRLYVSPRFRGLSLGNKLVGALLDGARSIGYGRVYLDSHQDMTPAHAVYRAAGFKDIPIPEDFPEGLRPHVVFMEALLA